ncbi:protein of unknown function (plasmid) [Cupriavidus neocaledonicus]|uniref:Uncharacterized protein n=1 Tax=Cupriavidus neocaledonicus TaxID=1040979 RepID=A0A375HRC2_9BURK|nr:hypothetical protein CBM2605_B50086 [Cupriavidus neocaledonicus]SPD60751.1 protein of unknown function [Cupriavidus neocaledonicus]
MAWQVGELRICMDSYPSGVVGNAADEHRPVAAGRATTPFRSGDEARDPAIPCPGALKFPDQAALTSLQARNTKAPARVAVPAPFPLKWPS